MFRPMGRLILTLAMAGGLLLLAPLFKATNIGGGAAWAQAQNGFNNSYFDKRIGGGTVSIMDTLETPIACALIYVFRYDEQLEECCGCPVTNSGGLRTIRLATIISPTTFATIGPQFPAVIPASVDSEFDTLTDNPANGEFLDRGVIKIVSSLPNGAGGTCDPTLPPQNATGVGVVDELREYSTSYQGELLIPPGPLPYGVTEHEWLGAPDPTASGEDASLTFLCGGIFALASHHGICGCGKGDNVPAPGHTGAAGKGKS